ncbi:MAG: hypothetical protein AAF621_04100 [Pseudomonadota bacterium]
MVLSALGRAATGTLNSIAGGAKHVWGVATEEPLRIMVGGALEDIGVKAAEKAGLTDLASTVIASPILLAQYAMTPKPKKTMMDKALSFIQRPSVLAATGLTLASLYALGAMQETPDQGQKETDQPA